MKAGDDRRDQRELYALPERELTVAGVVRGGAGFEWARENSKSVASGWWLVVRKASFVAAILIGCPVQAKFEREYLIYPAEC